MVDKDPAANAGNEGFEEFAVVQALIDRRNKESITTYALLEAIGATEDEHARSVRRMRDTAMAMLIVKKIHNPEAQLKTADIISEIVGYDDQILDLLSQEELDQLVQNLSTGSPEDPLTGVGNLFENIVDFAETHSVSPAMLLENDKLYFEYLARVQTPSSYADSKAKELDATQYALLSIMALAMSKEGMIDEDLTEDQKISMVMYLIETSDEDAGVFDEMQSKIKDVARSKLAYGIIMGWGMHEIDMINDNIRKKFGLLPSNKSFDPMESPEIRYQAIAHYCETEGWDLSSLTKEQQIQIFQHLGIIV